MKRGGKNEKRGGGEGGKRKEWKVDGLRGVKERASQEGRFSS